jgi:hypothetical protein
MIRILPAVVVFALWVFCLVDVITTRDDRVRHLPKIAWLVIVFLFPFVGSIVWLVAGRPAKERPLTREQGAAPGFSEYERPGRFAAADPAKDEEFLRQVRQRAEEQRRAHEERKRREREGEPEA